MILDEYGEFCENYDLDQETGTYLATNQIDLGAAPTLKNIGDGQPVYVVFTVTEAFTDGGDSATLDCRIVSDNTASIHATTSTLHVSTGTMLKAALTLGKQFALQLPVQATYERYLGINFVVGTAGFDTGMITAGISLTPPTNVVALPDAL